MDGKRGLLARALYRSLFRAAGTYQANLRAHGSLDLLLQRASKAFFPFNRAHMPDSRLDAHCALDLGHGTPRDALRSKFEDGGPADIGEGFRRLRQLDALNRIKPQVAAMCAPVERPGNLEFNVGHMCTAAADREWAGVILGWDETPVKQPGHGAVCDPLDPVVHKTEPFYYVVCNNPTGGKDLRPLLRYVPQSALRQVPTWEEFQTLLRPGEGDALQKWLSYFFEGRPCGTSGRLEPNPHLRRRYPDTTA